MSNLSLYVAHGAGKPKVNHGQIIFVPDATNPTTKGTFTVATIHLGTEGPPWQYTVSGSSLAATLSPTLRLTDQGNPSLPHIHYSELSGTVSGMDSSGNFSSVSSGGLVVAPGKKDRPEDEVDTWDASTTQGDHEGHHHHKAKA